MVSFRLFRETILFEYSQFVLLSLQIYHYVYSENNALNYQEMVPREEHMYLEATLYHTNLLHENQIF